MTACILEPGYDATSIFIFESAMTVLDEISHDKSAIPRLVYICFIIFYILQFLLLHFLNVISVIKVLLNR